MRGRTALMVDTRWGRSGLELAATLGFGAPAAFEHLVLAPLSDDLVPDVGEQADDDQRETDEPDGDLTDQDPVGKRRCNQHSLKRYRSGPRGAVPISSDASRDDPSAGYDPSGCSPNRGWAGRRLSRQLDRGAVARDRSARPATAGARRMAGAGCGAAGAGS